jgi:hypothetical protein
MQLILLLHYFVSKCVLQFSTMKEQGTRIIIYNLWEDDQGELELDFDADIHVCSIAQNFCHYIS